MYNGIRSAAEAVHRDGLMPRFMRALQPASAAHPPPGTQPAPAQPPFARSVETPEETRARTWTDEESRLRVQIISRMGHNRGPAEVTQAMTAWFRDARSSWRRDQMANLARAEWRRISANLSNAAEHADAADAWYNSMFHDPAESNNYRGSSTPAR